MQKFFIAAIGLFLLTLFSGCFYTVRPSEQVIITSFGKIVGEVVKEPGLHFKLPFIQDVNRIDKRVMEWDGLPLMMQTLDKLYLDVDTFARWRISDPVKYFTSTRDVRTALSRLDTVLGSATQGEIAQNELIELIQTKPVAAIKEVAVPLPTEGGGGAVVARPLKSIQRGRKLIAERIITAVKPGLLTDFGIDLLDLKFKRLNYSRDMQEKIYSRMASERKQIAERFRSEGTGEGSRIEGDRERELKKINSEAYRRVQDIAGKADAEAVKIYAGAYNASPSAADFYQFTRTLETYEKVVDENMTVVLSTDTDLFRMLKGLPPPPPVENK